MQTDVKSAVCAAGASTTAVSGRVRLKGLTISYASGGTVVVTDGNGGATLYSFTAPLAVGATNILIPGEGILANTGLYVTNAAATTASVFYG
tara:strand:- start:334 stop:609 length:276 start_codon:yes stop_codon:yes gene_type:complete